MLHFSMSEQHEVDNLLSVSQAAAKLGVNRSAIYQAVRAGRLAAVKIAGHIYISREAADGYTPLPPSSRKGKGLSIGGRPVSKPPSTEPKRPRGRPTKSIPPAPNEELPPE